MHLLMPQLYQHQDQSSADKIRVLKAAIRLAHDAHQGQVDKAGQAYILHPLRVLHAVNSLDGKIVAILHDTLEDTWVNLWHLHHIGLHALHLNALIALSKQPGESRFQALKRTLTNPLACYVKYADVCDNMNLARLDKIAAEDLRRYQSYLIIFEILQNACIVYHALNLIPAVSATKPRFQPCTLILAIRLAQQRFI